MFMYRLRKGHKQISNRMKEQGSPLGNPHKGISFVSPRVKEKQKISKISALVLNSTI
jgi:hypothetical protein